MNKYAIGGGFSLPSDGSQVALAAISLSAGTYRITAGAYADPTNTYTISGYDSIAFPVYQPHFNLPSRYGSENYDLLDLGIFVIAEASTITLYGYNEHGVSSAGSMSVLIADAVTV
jgi:hypothetical protein